MGTEAQKLRQAVLQSAMSGKLVPQDPDDEPASVLLERIAEEKKQLIKAKKIKMQKPLPPVSKEDEPFEIPESWKWVRFSNVYAIYNGDRGKNYPAKSTLQRDGIPFVSALNLANNTVKNDENLLCITESQLNALHAGKMNQGDMLICIRGSLGKHGIYPYPIGAIASSLVIVRDIADFDADKAFLSTYVDSPLFRLEIEQLDNGTAQPNLAAASLARFKLPLPPLNEQRRIADKLDELMPLIDEFEKLEDELTALEMGLPEKLKQSILQATIQGQLVPQDPDDEPASVLLERIADEKAQLVDDGKLRKQKELPPVKVNEQPFDVPDSWEWCRYGEVASSTLGKTLNKSKDTGVPVEYLCSINIQNDAISLSTVKKAPFTEAERQKYRLQPGDLLICEGGDAGKSAIWNIDREMYYQNALHCSRFHAGQEPHYIKLLLDLYRSQGLLTGASKGMTIQHLVQATLNNLIVPLPPLAEQHRIVAKIEEVMPVIDSIKQDVSNAQRT